jgi:hypothetical protein
MPSIAIVAEGKGWASLAQYARELKRRYGLSLQTALGWVYDRGTGEALWRARKYAVNHPGCRKPRALPQRRPERWSSPWDGGVYLRTYLGLVCSAIFICRGTMAGRSTCCGSAPGATAPTTMI